MDRTTLRARQAPLRELYTQNPAAALTPLHATADFREGGVTTTVDGFAGAVRAGLHRATGGSGNDACSGDLLLQALLACAGVTLRSVAIAMGLQVRSAQLSAEAAFDARGTLGLDRDVPVGLTPITVSVVVDCEADDETLDRLGRTTERYCVVGQSLATPPTVVVRRAR